MNRLYAIVGSAVVVGLVGIPAALAQTAVRTVSNGQGQRFVSAVSGTIEGTVADERGRPLPGVMVSALGVTSAIAVTDGRGRFSIPALPSGAYTVRAHLSGFAPSRRQVVDVRSASAAYFSITLQKTDLVAVSSAKSIPIPPPPPPKILSAGLVAGAELDPFLFDPLGMRDDSANGAEDRTEKAWRIRHLPRSVLKDTTEREAKAPENAGALEKEKDKGKTQGQPQGQPGTASAIARSMGAPARLLGDLPFTGQVNLMTSGSFDGNANVSSSDAVHGTAHFALAGPAGGFGDWSATVLTQADLGSWFLAGAFKNRAPSRNRYDVGFSYSTQRFASTTSVDRLGFDRTDVAGRAAGSIYGIGRLVLTPRVMLDYGGRYSRYDYLPGGLVSPSVMVTLVPLDRVRIRAGVSRRMLAPGAEEFLEPLTPGLWVPPERTFVGFAPMVPERTSQFEVALERDLAAGLVVAFRSFHQETTDQQMAFFSGVPAGDQRHYAIGNVGNLVAQGWSIGIAHHLLAGLQGSLAYEVTDARWMAGLAPGQELLVLGFVPRPATERLHDLTTSLEADVPFTATHVLVAARVNTGFAKRETDGLTTGLDSRFDFQVTQRLPFLDFTSAQWQVLVAVKNMFRETTRDSSVYDELLVIKPPTRLLGGFVVKF
jgi:hypothetical protein